MSVDVMDSYGVKETKSSLRKSNKPIMEKRRRERINNCLTQLKTLVLESMKKDSSQYSKLEKADILEMTVKYLRNVQRQQLANAIASDPNVVSKYRAGYHECASEVTRYLDATQNVGPDVKSRLAGHLSDCLQEQTMCKTSFGHHKISTVREQIDSAKPLSVQIPNNNSNFSPVSNSNSLLITGSQSPQQNAMNLCQTGHSSVTSSPGRNMHQTANISGQFQILPSGNVYNGPIAIYMGNVNQPNSPPQSTIPIFTLHVPETASSPSQVLSKSTEYLNNIQGNQIAGNFNSCLRLSEEKLWRPW